MSTEKRVHRVLPTEIRHPRRARRISEDEFKRRAKEKVEDVPQPVCEGHAGTEIWWCDPGYVLRVKFAGRSDELIESPSTFTPTFGMDRFDGEMAQDAEEWILQQVLGRPAPRLDVFHGADSVGPHRYVEARSLEWLQPTNPPDATQGRRWWQFWK